MKDSSGLGSIAASSSVVCCSSALNASGCGIAVLGCRSEEVMLLYDKVTGDVVIVLVAIVVSNVVDGEDLRSVVGFNIVMLLG